MNKYEIKTIEDFFKIPADRLDACLEEFKEFIGIVAPLVNMADKIADSAGVKRTDVEKFTWIDDGKKNKTIKINTTILKKDSK